MEDTLSGAWRDAPTTPSYNGLDPLEPATTVATDTPTPEKTRRNLKPWLISIALALVIIALGTTTYVGFASAADWHDKHNTQVARGDELQTKLDDTTATLTKTEGDLVEANRSLTSLKGTYNAERAWVTSDVKPVLDQYRRCVDSITPFLNNLRGILYGLGDNSSGTSMGAECGTALGKHLIMKSEPNAATGI